MLHCNILESIFAHHLSLVVWGDSRLLWGVVGSTRLLEKPRAGLPANTVLWNPVTVLRLWGQLRGLAI